MPAESLACKKLIIIMYMTQTERGNLNVSSLKLYQLEHFPFKFPTYKDKS